MARQDTIGREDLAGRRTRMWPERLQGRKGGKRPVLTLATPPGSPPPSGGRRRRRGVASTVWLAVVPAGILLAVLTVLVLLVPDIFASPRRSGPEAVMPLAERAGPARTARGRP
jgi:hypothetical protein